LLQLEISSRVIDMSELDPLPGSKFVEIRNELDGPVSNFGKLAGIAIVKALKQADAWDGSRITKITYEDRYVRSPLVLKLLIDTVTELFRISGSQSGELDIATTQVRTEYVRSPPFRIEHDWNDSDVHRDVAAAYGELSGVQVDLRVTVASHSRKITITNANGSKSRIILDQGFGAWSTQASKLVRHDFRSSASSQARSMKGLKEYLHLRGFAATYIVAVKET
jgi:DEAD/DEAH box helicase domain-containing protein